MPGVFTLFAKKCLNGRKRKPPAQPSPTEKKPKTLIIGGLKTPVSAIDHFPKQGGFFWHLPLCRGFFQTEKSAKKRVFPNRGVFKELGGESAVPGVFEGKKNRNSSEKTGFFDQKSSIYPRILTFEGRNLRFHEKQLFFLILRAFQGVTRGKTRVSARPQASIQVSLPRPSPAKTPSKWVPNGAQTHRF